MKLLHTSDWHLGMTFRSGITYSQDQKAFIDEICDIAIKNKVDGILIAGDVFDKSIASQEALALYDNAMTYICGNLGISVYIIAGNHDGASRLSSCNRLLEKSGLHIVGSIKEEPQIVHLEDVNLYFLPWISTDKVCSLFPDKAEDINSLEDAYRVVLDSYRQTMDKSKKNIILSHAYIATAQTSTSDRTAEIGKATVVSCDVFEGFDYVALGHLHGPQQITDSIRYSGTPMAYSFGKEEKQEKSVTILDTDTMECQIIPLHPYRLRNTLSGTYEELMSMELSEEVRTGFIKLDVKDCIVGIEVMSAFRERFPNLMEITGKSLEADAAKITMTLDEFEDKNTDPESVFGKYCMDMLGEEPSEHILELFKKALEQFENGEGNE